VSRITILEYADLPHSNTNGVVIWYVIFSMTTIAIGNLITFISSIFQETGEIVTTLFIGIIAWHLGDIALSFYVKRTGKNKEYRIGGVNNG